MRLKRWILRSLLLTLVFGVGDLGLVSRDYAASTFSVTDKQAGYTAPEEKVTITGSSMLWLGKDKKGSKQIFSRNLETGELKQLTTTSSYKEHLAAGGGYAVYLDNQYYIVIVNLQSGEATQTDIKPFPYVQLSIDGHYVTYCNDFEKMLNVYDMKTKAVKQIGEGKNATIVNGIVVYSSDTESKIMLYDAGKGTSRQLVKVTEGYIANSDQFAFNGKNVVWTHRSYAGKSQTRILDVEEMDPLPKVLNAFVEMPKFPYSIVVGDNIAAWSSMDNGKAQITATDLTSRQTDTVAENGEQVIGIYRDQLILKDKDNKVVLRSIKLTGQGQTITETLVSAIPTPDKAVPDQAKGQLGGRHPISQKQIALSDNSVILSSEDTTSDGDFITITHSEGLALTEALKTDQKMVSQPWSVYFQSQPTNDVKLSMTYLAERVPEGQIDKLGIYRLDSGVWTYMGGLFEGNKERLYANIIKSGIYIVLYQNVPNQSLKDYWMQKKIEQLNASKPIRIILNGDELAFHEQPVLKNGSTTIEFRPIFEKLGLKINWDGATKTITGKKQGMLLQLTLGQSSAVVNGSSSKLPTAPFLNHEYTFVPLRFIGEATGLKVLWDINLKTVYIYDPATEGKLYYSSGVMQYEGQLKNGKMNGKGKLYREDGTLWYDAEFLNNEVIGWGTLYFAGFSRGRDRTGEVSIGQFTGGLPEGYVYDINDNGNIQYEGQVIQGVFNGKGKYYEQDKLVYDGGFKDNLFEGYGKFYRDGKLDFEGVFVKNVPNGYGIKYKQDGNVYEEGEYLNGVLQK